MTQAARFCAQCGAALNAGARFCAQCGNAIQVAQPPSAAQPPAAQAPVAAAPSAAPVAGAPQGESVVGVIAGLQRRKGLLGYETFNVVVTPGRLVFALMTQQMMNDAVRQAQQEAKSQGKGLLGQMAAQMGWLGIMSERYHATLVEAALAEQPENFFLPNSQIRQVKLERRENRQKHTHSDHVLIVAASGKYEFEIKGANPGDVKQLLGRVLGAAVR